ncbi:MAG: DNA-processing protein DprA [Prevotella sp.]|uniref:DNA-processing protein DprA n=1 Tax=Prevotella sp. TaxID=59823 RepID=UPI002A2CDE6A|nr:DNA-processing protein DprA [Prevotella sp.]MDD7318405.1 DNA-processing protein DprA [Prevotellaceae bacterium]MDY4020244.1 DNA-processing protein DprA [Prevotella sp.]
MDEKEILSALALMRINYFSLSGLSLMYRELGSASLIVEHRNNIRELFPDASEKLANGLRGIDAALSRAEAEMDFCSKHGIEPLVMNDSRYPARLRECDDAPLVLFYRGNADLNRQRVVSIVGTRHCTAYGREMTDRFVSELKRLCPKVLIVSGLAYGVDINAHRAALNNGYETVGVLAHGLDRIYPARHRDTAVQMIGRGGLLTEFFTQTNADKVNFVRRNRIVAGMSDACILVESAAKGGGLITARLARDYNRDVFAFPGKVGDEYSVGCNNLIRSNGAALITSAQDFVDAMVWNTDAELGAARQRGIERQLFPSLSAEECAVADALQRQNDMQMNMISVKTDITIARLTAILFEMELKGVVKPLAGGAYHLLG